MRIVFALPSLAVNGGNKVAISYAESLMQNGHDVRVVHTEPPEPSQAKKAKGMLKGLLTGKPSPHAHRAKLETTVPISRSADPRVLSRDDFPDADVVIATWWETAEWVAQLPQSKGVKCHLIQDHEVFPYLPQDRTVAVYKLPWPKIVVSKWLERLCLDRYGASLVHYVPNGLDLNHFRDPGPAQPRAERVGMLWAKAPRKNAAMGLEAILLAKRALPDLEAICFGSPKRPPEMVDLDWIEYHQLPDQRNIPSIYASCAAWLLPSSSEGFGLPLLEAMAMRTPVVSTKAGAAPDLIDGANGVLVECTAQAMGEGLIRMVSEPENEWLVRSRAARRTAQDHDQRHSAAKFEAALMDIFERGSSSSLSA